MRPILFGVQVVAILLLAAIAYVQHQRVAQLKGEVDRLEEVALTNKVAAQMREMGVCLWRDHLHQSHRDDIWARDERFRADMRKWCGREPQISVF